MRLVAVLAVAAFLQPLPDFSGRWEFDREKTMQPGPDGRIVLAAMLGDAVTVRQSRGAITFAIEIGGETIKAVYNLDGSETRNLSPGPPGGPEIPVTSTASWDGGRLVIFSRSLATEKGVAVTVETRRVLSIDREGHLIVERTGTPASLVTPSRSIYRRVKALGATRRAFSASKSDSDCCSWRRAW